MASARRGGARARGGGGAALLQSPGKAASFLDDLVHEVLVKPRVGTAGNVGQPSRGTDLP